MLLRTFVNSHPEVLALKLSFSQSRKKLEPFCYFFSLICSLSTGEFEVSFLWALICKLLILKPVEWQKLQVEIVITTPFIDYSDFFMKLQHLKTQLLQQLRVIILIKSNYLLAGLNASLTLSQSQVLEVETLQSFVDQILFSIVSTFISLYDINMFFWHNLNRQYAIIIGIVLFQNTFKCRL